MLPQNPTDGFEGYPVIMDCIAEGDPKPTIQWDKNTVMNDFDQKRLVQSIFYLHVAWTSFFVSDAKVSHKIIFFQTFQTIALYSFKSSF